MKHRWFGVLTVLLVAGMGCVMSALWPPPPTPEVPTETFLIDLSAFPPGWWVDIPPYRGDERIGQADDRWIQFRCEKLFGGPLALHQVYWFARERDAAIEYKLQQKAVFFSAERLTPWERPAELPYESPVADRFRFACAQIEDFPSGSFTLCTAIGQYGPYLSIFSIHVTPGCLTFEDLGRILQAIDRRMSKAK